jgi:transcriptional regulator with XRE-family HTH domain
MSSREGLPIDGVMYAADVGLKELLGRRVRQLREAAGLSQDQLAKRIGYAPSQVSAVERGVNFPGMDMAQALAVEFRCDVADLLVFPGESLRHDLREELRKITNRDNQKIEDLLRVTRLVSRVSIDKAHAVLRLAEVALREGLTDENQTASETKEKS